LSGIDLKERMKNSGPKKISHISHKTSALAGLRFHFIGTGGVGMSGLAMMMMKNKALVTGSDQTDSTVIAKMRQMGADIKIGHAAENLGPAADAVVISAAITEDNPELALARKRGLKVYKYAQMLGILMDLYDGIAVSGTHGKSTTSGWLTYCLKQIGCDPSFIIGAELIQLAGSSGVGNGRYFVAEACEYDRSFLNLKPKIGCILNIEQDHLDYYKDEAEIVDAFYRFAAGIRPTGTLIINGTDPNCSKIIRRLQAGFDCRTFGLAESCDFYALNLQLKDRLYSFDVYNNGKLLGTAQISLPGMHNVANALAVVAMAVNAGIEPADILKALPLFAGMDRRLMLKGNFRGVTVLDDYAHHPTEIKASLEAIRQRYRPKKLWCIFQPHQYSRTRFLLNDFAESFKLADVTIAPEIYFVRDSESSRQEVNSQMLVEKIQNSGSDALFIDGFDKICEYLRDNVTDGDVVVTMGAGNIGKVADEYIQWLGTSS